MCTTIDAEADSKDRTSQPEVSEGALLSEAALAEDWDRPEEAAAWAHFSEG